MPFKVGSLQLYKSENGRTQTVTFRANKDTQSVDVGSGELIDSPADAVSAVNFFEELKQQNKRRTVVPPNDIYFRSAA